MLGAILCTIVLTGCGSGDAVKPEPASAVTPERELRYAQYHDIFLYACRDADLGDTPSAKHTRRLEARAREIIRTAEAHPDDVFDDGERPSDRLHTMADLAACVPAVAKRLEIAARDAASLEPAQ